MRTSTRELTTGGYQVRHADKKYLKTLTPEERNWLTGLVCAGRPAPTLTRAASAQGRPGRAWPGVGRHRHRRGPGLRPPHPQVGPRRSRARNPRGHRLLLVVDCPDGRSRWNSKLLADRLARPEVVQSFRDERMRRWPRKGTTVAVQAPERNESAAGHRRRFTTAKAQTDLHSQHASSQ